VTDSDASVIRFQTCNTLAGSSHGVGIGRRNGHPVAFFSPDWTDHRRDDQLPYSWLDDTRYYVNLNPIEQRTWRKVLNGESIASIAQDEGVSRQAVYDRIKGNAKGHGGMIGKNFWVLLWWRLRQENRQSCTCSSPRAALDRARRIHRAAYIGRIAADNGSSQDRPFAQ
jgi:hypothetical protein